MKETKKDGMKLIQNLIPPIISLAIFVVMSMLMATSPSINHEIDEYFWIQTIGSIFCMVLTFVVWTPTGERMAWGKSRVINNKKLYDYRANYIIGHQMFTKLKEFCDVKNTERKKEIIQDTLSDGDNFKHTNGNIDYWVYELYVKKEKTPEEQERCDKVMATYDTAQQDLIKKLATSKIKFEHLTPQAIIMGRSKHKSIVNKDTSKSYEIGYVSIKSIWGLFTSCFTYFIIIEPNSQFGIAQAIMIFMWFFTFLSAIYSAIRIGYNAIYNKKTQYNIEQGILCGDFMTYAGVPAEDMNPPKDGTSEEN